MRFGLSVDIVDGEISSIRYYFYDPEEEEWKLVDCAVDGGPLEWDLETLQAEFPDLEIEERVVTEAYGKKLIHSYKAFFIIDPEKYDNINENR